MTAVIIFAAIILFGVGLSITYSFVERVVEKVERGVNEPPFRE